MSNVPSLLIVGVNAEDTNGNSTSSWVDLSNVLPDAHYSDVYAIGDEVWITSGSSNVLYYNDAAGTTDFVTYSTPGGFRCIHMLNPNEGYAGAESGRVFRTTDGGVNWTLLLPLTGAAVSSITFPPTGEPGYCCGEVGRINSVTSTGTTKMTSNVVSNMASIFFPTSDEGWVCGEDVILHYTSASGQWNADQSYPGNFGCRAVFFTDNNNGWIVGGIGSAGAIIHTTDGGTNWMYQTDPNPSNAILNAVFFLDDGLTGWAAGNFGKVLSTTDGGNTWNIENTGAIEDLLRSIHFTSSTNGFIVGNSGNAFKFVGGNGENHPPVISDINPIHGSDNVALQPMLSAYLSDADDVQWWIKSNVSGAWIILEEDVLTSGTGSVSTSNTMAFQTYNTRYFWSVNCTDGSAWTNQTYMFTTSNDPGGGNQNVDHGVPSITILGLLLLIIGIIGIAFIQMKRKKKK